MLVTRRVYVSLPADQWLSPSMNDLKWAIVDEIENLGYTPEIFTNPRGKPGLASSRAWGARDADEVARRCLGAAVIGMARWKFHDVEGRDVRTAADRILPLRRLPCPHARPSDARPGPKRRSPTCGV